MSKEELFNDIKRVENEWVDVLCETMEWGNVDELKEKHLRTDEELQKAYDQEGEDYLIGYKEVLEDFIEDVRDDKEIWKEIIKECMERSGIVAHDIPKVPLI